MIKSFYDFSKSIYDLVDLFFVDYDGIYMYLENNISNNFLVDSLYVWLRNGLRDPL